MVTGQLVFLDGWVDLQGQISGDEEELVAMGWGLLAYGLAQYLWTFLFSEDLTCNGYLGLSGGEQTWIHISTGNVTQLKASHFLVHDYAVDNMTPVCVNFRLVTIIISFSHLPPPTRRMFSFQYHCRALPRGDGWMDGHMGAAVTWISPLQLSLNHSQLIVRWASVPSSCVGKELTTIAESGIFDLKWVGQTFLRWSEISDLSPPSAPSCWTSTQSPSLSWRGRS